jgi:hypothetical protein
MWSKEGNEYANMKMTANFIALLWAVMLSFQNPHKYCLPEVLGCKEARALLWNISKLSGKQS